MSYFYSKTTNGFYHTTIHGTNVPADAVEITDGEHARLMEGQQTGFMIKPNEDGFPTLVVRPDSLEEQIGMTMEELHAHIATNFPQFAHNWSSPTPKPKAKKA